MKNGKLLDLLENVPTHSPNFVPCMIATIKHYQIGDEIKQYLIKNPEATANDVLKYVDELIDYS